MKKKPKDYYKTPLRKVVKREYQKAKTKEKDLTQEKFAERIGISASFLSDIMSGVAKGYNQIEEIAEGLNVSPVEIFMELEEPQIQVYFKHIKNMTKKERRVRINNLEREKQEREAALFQEFKKMRCSGKNP